MMLSPSPFLCALIALEHHVGWPAGPVLLPLSVVAHLFPDTDLRHIVLTPLRVYAAECLGMAPVWTLRDAACGLFVATIMWRLHQRSQRFVPEAFVFLERSLACLLGAGPAGGTARPREMATMSLGPGLSARNETAVLHLHPQMPRKRTCRPSTPTSLSAWWRWTWRPPSPSNPLPRRRHGATRPPGNVSSSTQRRANAPNCWHNAWWAIRWSLLQATLRLAVAYVDLYSSHSAVTAVLRPLTAALARTNKQLRSFPPAVKVRRH